MVMSPVKEADVLNNGAACVRLDAEDLPDHLDFSAGDWFACNEPPADDACMQCFQLEDLPNGAGENGTPKLNEQKPWLCIDRVNTLGSTTGDDSY